MTDHLTARRMQQAADDMQQAARNIDGTIERFSRFLDDWLLRLENVLERQLAPKVVNVEQRMEVDERVMPGLLDVVRRQGSVAKETIHRAGNAEIRERIYDTEPAKCPVCRNLLEDGQHLVRAEGVDYHVACYELTPASAVPDVEDQPFNPDFEPPPAPGSEDPDDTSEPIDPVGTDPDFDPIDVDDPLQETGFDRFEERAKRLQEMHEVADGAYGDGPMVRGAARREVERLQEEDLPPDLSKTERFLLAWLSKEESSAYGECNGKDLDRLVALGYAQIEPAGPAPRPDSRVSLTEDGWARHRQIIRES
jgi:hypothetical protein